MTKNEPSQREIDLWESNQLLEQVFSNVDFLVAYMDSQFNYLRVNRAFAEGEVMFPEASVGKNHFELYPNDEIKAIFKRVVETGEAFSAESHPSVFQNHPKWGNNYWNWNLQAVKDPNGNVSRLVFSLMDVTERKRAETQNRILASIVESSEDAIYSYSLDGIIASWNKGAEKVYGYPSEEVIGRSNSLLFSQERQDEFRNIVEEVK